MLRESPVRLAWGAEVILGLADGPKRFNGLFGPLERLGCSDRVLTLRLRELEDASLVDRQVLAGPPIAVIYGLTVAGRRYVEPLQAFAAVDAKHVLREAAVG